MSDVDAHDAIGVQLTDLLDAGAEKNAIEEAALVAEFEEARSGRNLLASLTPQATPVGFSRRVQTRVRRRTGGRFFHPADRPFGYVVSVEAFVVLAVAVMAACWLMLDNRRQAQSPTLFLDPPAMEKSIPSP